MIGFPKIKTAQDLAMEQKYPMLKQQAQVDPRMQMQAQQQMQQQMQQPKSGLAGILDRMNTRSSSTGLSGYENFAQALDALILPELRSGDAIRARGAQRIKDGNKNKTVEMLIKAGRQDLADMVLAGTITLAQAANVLLTAPKDTRTSQIKNYEYFKSLGLSHEEALAQVQSGTNVNLNTGGDMSEFAKLDAKELSNFAKEALGSTRMLGRIDRLESLLAGADTGAVGYFKNLAGNFGIETDGLGDIQAAVALINSMVPEQRQEGSGPMSDADLALFKTSMPRLINTRAGNALIIQTMREMALYDQQTLEIINKHRRNPTEFTIADTYQALENRPKPFEKGEFVQRVNIASGDVVPPMPENFTQATGMTQNDWNSMTPTQRAPFMQ